MTLSTILKKAAAWGILLILVILLASQIIVPVVGEYRMLSEDIETKRRLATKLSQTIGTNEMRARQAELDVDRLTNVGGLLNATEGGRADTEIREYFVEAVRVAGGKVQSSQNLLVETESAFQRHTLRANMSADIDQLVEILHRLETQQPFLFVERMQIQSQHNAAAANQKSPLLRVQLNVVGYSSNHKARQ